MVRLSCLLAAVASAALAAPVPKALKAKVPELNGTWEVVEWHSNGNKVNNAITMKWTIDGEALSIERNNPKGGVMKNPTVTYTLARPDAGGNALDYTINYANNANPSRVLPGVFEMDGDTLKFCMANQLNGTRPAECKPGQGVTYYEFKRVEAK